MGFVATDNPFHSKRRILSYGILAALLSLLILALRPPVLNEANQVARDRVFRWREAPEPHPDVVVVVVDQQSVEAVGRWPWSRTRQAELIGRIKEAGAGTIALDIAYLHPESLEADHALETVLSAPGTPVVGGYFFRPQTNTDQLSSLSEHELSPLARLELEAIQSMTPMVPDVAMDQVLSQAIFAFPRVEAVQPSIARHLTALGFFNFLPEQDGRVRKLPLVIRHGVADALAPGESFYPALVLQALAVHRSPHRDVPRDLELEAEGEVWLPFRERIDLRVGHEGLTGIALGEQVIPVNHHGQFNVNFYFTGKPIDGAPLARAEASEGSSIFLANGTGLPFISASTLLNARQPEELARLREALSGKLVFVGLTEQGITDFQPTPVSQQFPGVAIQATAAANILAQQYLADGTDALLLTVLLTALLPGLTVYLLAKTRKPLFIATVAVVALLLPFSGFLYMALKQNTLLGFIYPTVGVVIAIFMFSAYHVRVSQEKTRHLVNGFGKFLSPELVDDFLNNARWWDLNTERDAELREITVLFSDIRGFTTISERLESASRLFKLLNRYLGDMAAIVKEHDGHLDKFIGDAVMAIYNAPVLHDDHAARAAATALAMQRQLKVLNQTFIKKFDVELKVGIGLHSGEASVGNLGNDHHLEYTAMGDPVNQASRLEGATKIYGVPILITESIHRQLPAQFVCREIDTVLFKGKEKEFTTIYELMGDTPDPERLALKVAYEEALGIYKSGDFEAAEAAFTQVEALAPGGADGPSKQLIERCQNYRQTPPPDWNGVFKMTEK